MSRVLFLLLQTLPTQISIAIIDGHRLRAEKSILDIVQERDFLTELRWNGNWMVGSVARRFCGRMVFKWFWIEVWMEIDILKKNALSRKMLWVEKWMSFGTKFGNLWVLSFNIIHWKRRPLMAPLRNDLESKQSNPYPQELSLWIIEISRCTGF